MSFEDVKELKYRFAEATRAPGGLSAETIGTELEKIRREKGEFRPQDVVDAAKSDSHPLHRAFEWNDDIAAEKYRLEQARAIIRSVVLVDVKTPEAKGVRAFVSIDVGKKYPVYTGIINAMQVKETREQVVEKAYRELHAFTLKYHVLLDFADLFDTVRKARDILKDWIDKHPK